jgi:hypothetical protein
VEVLLDGEVGEHPALLGDERDAVHRNVLGVTPRDALAVEPDLTRAHLRRHRARDGAQRRRLAGAVPAQEGADLPLIDRQRQLPEDVALVVVGVDGVDLEQAHSSTPPRYASWTSGSP